MVDRADVPVEIVDRMQAICLALPEAVEQRAWVGTRWRIRAHTFAHVVMIDGGWPPGYARTFGSSGPLVTLTFRSSGDELEALGRLGPPFCRPPWAPNVVGMSLGDDVDWPEVAELITESYCLLAPKRLAARVARPDP